MLKYIILPVQQSKSRKKTETIVMDTNDHCMRFKNKKFVGWIVIIDEI